VDERSRHLAIEGEGMKVLFVDQRHARVFDGHLELARFGQRRAAGEQTGEIQGTCPHDACPQCFSFHLAGSFLGVMRQHTVLSLHWFESRE
jgi:hypothetical protein